MLATRHFQKVENGRSVARLRRVVGVGYCIGTVMALAVTQMHDTDPSDHRAFVVVAAIQAVLGALLLLPVPLPDAGTKFLSFAVPVAIVTALVVVARPLGAAPIYYVWPALTSAYFGSRREVRFTLVLTVVGFAAALAASEAEMRMTVYASTLAVVAGVAFVITRLNLVVDVLMQRLARTAAIDALTGLLNRRAFAPAFAREYDRARAARLPLSVVVFDLDHFKSINDAHGHAAGDAVLERFSALLSREQASGDLVARTGGEEFVAVLFGRDGDAARAFAQRVTDCLRDERAIPRVTVSAGVATLGPSHGSPEALVLASDRAMYAAKAAGRDRVVAVGDDLTDAVAA